MRLLSIAPEAIVSTNSTTAASACGPDRDRTDCLRYAIAALYQLSYRPLYFMMHIINESNQEVNYRVVLNYIGSLLPNLMIY